MKVRERGECDRCDSGFPIRGRCLNCRIAQPLIDAAISVLRRVCRATKYRAPGLYRAAGQAQNALHHRAARRTKTSPPARNTRPTRRPTEPR